MSLIVAVAVALTGSWSLAPAGASAVGAAPSPVATAPLEEAELVLRWPEPVRLETEAAPDEVVVRYDVPLPEAEIAAFAKAAGDRLADLRWNDNSLVLRPAPGTRLSAAAGTDSLAIRLVPEPEAATAEPESRAETGEIERELARAQADAAAGYPGQARRRLTRLAAQHPEDKAVARALADAEAADGALLLAADRYGALGADDLFARRTMAEADGRAAAQFLIRDGKTFSQWEAGGEASLRVSEALLLGAGLRHITTTAQGVASAAGYLPRIHSGATVGAIAATALIGPYGRVTAQLSSRIDRPQTGGSARLSFGSAEGQVRAVATYRVPDFSTAEQALLNGYINRLGGGGTLRLTPELLVQGDVSWNGYGLADSGVPTTSILVNGGIDYLLQRGRPSLQLSYRLDAEYVRRMRLRPGGAPFIPLSDRENHTVQAIFSMPVRTVQVTAAAGWTWDRFGGNGPTASLGAQAPLGDSWRLEAVGGVSSVSRPDISGRQFYVQLTLTRFLRRQ